MQLFAFKQTHCAFVACDSEWVTSFFLNTFLNIHARSVLKHCLVVRWMASCETAAVSAISAHSVYTIHQVRVNTESWPWWKQFSRCSCQDSNLRPFSHKCTELLPLPNHNAGNFVKGREVGKREWGERDNFLINSSHLPHLMGRTILVVCYPQ